MLWLQKFVLNNKTKNIIIKILIKNFKTITEIKFLQLYVLNIACMASAVFNKDVL